jgi:hypothetical protein
MLDALLRACPSEELRYYKRINKRMQMHAPQP